MDERRLARVLKEEEGSEKCLIYRKQADQGGEQGLGTANGDNLGERARTFSGTGEVRGRLITPEETETIRELELEDQKIEKGHKKTGRREDFTRNQSRRMKINGPRNII